jgi:predicted metal-dependent phosphoesterase TrpH
VDLHIKAICSDGLQFHRMLVDDFSRLLIHGRWVTDQNTRAGQDVLRAAIQRRGLPQQLHVDNADTEIMPTSLAVRSQAGLKLSA